MSRIQCRRSIRPSTSDQSTSTEDIPTINEMTEEVGLWLMIKSCFYRSFMAVLSVVTTIFHYTWKIQMECIETVYRVSCWVYAWDVRVLRKPRGYNKATALVALCVVPLLLIGVFFCWAELEGHLRKIVKEMLNIYDADRTGLVDYASKTMGGQILTTRCTENYVYGKAATTLFGIPLWYTVNSPRTVIQPNARKCWAFRNFPGFLVIELFNHIYVEAVSIEHINKLLVPEGRIDSAPKEFEIYGLNGENDKNPELLGSFVYDFNGEPLQFFQMEKVGRSFRIIELRIVSNHGNPNYTCLYRLRVHGKLATQES